MNIKKLDTATIQQMRLKYECIITTVRFSYVTDKKTRNFAKLISVQKLIANLDVISLQFFVKFTSRISFDDIQLYTKLNC